MNTKYITIIFKYIFFILALTTYPFTASSELSVEEFIKKEKHYLARTIPQQKKFNLLLPKVILKMQKVLCKR